jgi:hypothetical protein
MKGRNPGQAVKSDERKHVKAGFHGKMAPNTPDATLKRGAGPIFRASGGGVDCEGGASKPHGGRPGRKRGGGVGSDLKPLTTANSPSKPKRGAKLMPDAERTP